MIIKVFLILNIVLVTREVNAARRILLHSDDDVIQKLGALEQELHGMETELQGMKTDLTAKDQQIAILNQTLRQEIASFNKTLSQKDAVIATMQKKLQAVESAITGSGSTFVRWGRTTCGHNSSELLYKGFAAAATTGDTGSGSNMLCLPEHPTWGQYNISVAGAHIYGAEYYPGFKPLSFENYEDMPCAVCRTHLSTTVMIPASTGCLNNWKTQYTGYLMSSHAAYHPLDFICVDGHPEAVYHGERDLVGPEMFAVQAKCGVLPCQVYPDGRQLACAVCSK